MPATSAVHAGDTLSDSARSATPSITRRSVVPGPPIPCSARRFCPRRRRWTPRRRPPRRLADFAGRRVRQRGRRRGKQRAEVGRMEDPRQAAEEKRFFNVGLGRRWRGGSHSSGDRNAVDRVAGEVGPFCRKGTITHYAPPYWIIRATRPEITQTFCSGKKGGCRWYSSFKEANAWLLWLRVRFSAPLLSYRMGTCH